MTKRKFRFFLFMMCFSVLLLVVLQAFWIKAEHRSAAEAFKKETNLVFRNTMFHVNDSIFSEMIRELIEVQQDSIKSISFSSTTPRQFRITMGSDGSPPDSLMDAGDSVALAEHRLPFHDELIHTDSLAVRVDKAMKSHDVDLPLTLLKQEANWFESFRMMEESNDSLPFATSFVPLGSHSYAAQFSGVQTMLLHSIMPQIVFSLFITLLIGISFILVAKSLRSQQRLIEIKNDFIGNITHELKTPVATVEVALEALKHFDVLKKPDQTKEYLHMASLEVKRLGMITEKILRTSVFDYQEDIRLHKSPLDLAIIAEEVVSAFRFIAERKNISLVYSKKGETMIRGHQDHLWQVVYNLLDNALKYAEESPEIHIKLYRFGAHIHLMVKDSGPGIPEEHRSKIFDKFYRIPSGNVHTVKGHGLGLNYVKNVVRAHGGKILLESSPGKGAIFIVKLPAYE